MANIQAAGAVLASLPHRVAVRRFDASVDSEGVAPLAVQWAQRPYGQYGWLVSDTALERLAHSRLLRTLRSPECSAVVAGAGRQPVGLGAWTRLAWDSEQFGMPAARLDFLIASGDYRDSRRTKEQLLDTLLAQCRARGVRHLVTRVDAGDLSGLHALESAGFETIDGIQTFCLRLTDEAGEAAPQRCQVRLFQPQDLAQVLAIARSSYIFDRFHADAALSGETADAVNEAWLRNSCLGKMADAVVVACDGTRVAAYVTCKVDDETRKALGVCFGSIPMVATDVTARRKGAARAATAGALAWFRSQGVNLVEVGTQLRNIPAGRLYEQCGFRLSAASLTLRKVL